MKNAEKPILSISLLTSDRMKTIPRCLDSLIPLREAIPCELIIVDTSKNPEVHALALSHTDMVETFEWCHDFAKARNVGLKKAKGEWFMFIDDDEWFLEVEPLIEFFKSGEYKEYGYAHYRVRNYNDSEFKTYIDGWVTRLIKLKEETAFHSKVHEHLAPVEGKDKALDALIGHSGYIFVNQDEREKHFERNSTLLKKMEEEEPDNLRWKVQQIQEYRSIFAWEELKEYCEKTIKYIEVEGRKVVLQDLQQIYIGYLISLVNTKDYEKALNSYNRFEAVFTNGLMARAFAEICVAEAYYGLKDDEKMKKYAENFLWAYKEYLKNPRKHERESLRIILSTAFGNERVCAANSMLVEYELHRNNTKKIKELYPKLRWNELGIKPYLGMERKLLNYFLEQKDEEMLKKILQDGLSSLSIRSRMMSAILDVQTQNRDEYMKVLEMVKCLDIDAWYKPYASLLTLEENVSKELVWEYAVSFIKSSPNFFEVPNEIKNIILEYGFEVESLYKEIDFLAWREGLIENLERMQMRKVEDLKTQLENSSLRQDIRFGYFMIIYHEQKLLKEIDVMDDSKEYGSLLYYFSEYTIQTYDVLFGEQLQQMEIEELPDNYQAAMWLRIYFEEAEKNLSDALPCLERVASSYPMFMRIIKYYLLLLEKKMIIK